MRPEKRTMTSNPFDVVAEAFYPKANAARVAVPQPAPCPHKHVDAHKQDSHGSGWFSWYGTCEDCGAEVEGQGFEPGYSHSEIEWDVVK
jgi:hypothetical protein